MSKPLPLGQRLLRCRQQAHMTIPELAARSGIATGTISNAENGSDIRVSTLQKLAKALKITINDLHL